VTNGSSPVLTPSANLKKAVVWLGETMQEHPEKKREKVLQEAQLRFDLTPAECEFLQNNFSKAASGTLNL